MMPTIIRVRVTVTDTWDFFFCGADSKVLGLMAAGLGM